MAATKTTTDERTKTTQRLMQMLDERFGCPMGVTKQTPDQLEVTIGDLDNPDRFPVMVLGFFWGQVPLGQIGWVCGYLRNDFGMAEVNEMIRLRNESV